VGWGNEKSTIRLAMDSAFLFRIRLFSVDNRLAQSLSEQTQYLLWVLVGNRENRNTSLVQNLSFGHVCGFDSEVGIHDLTTGFGNVFQSHTQ
jgi:hypothetical protein